MMRASTLLLSAALLVSAAARAEDAGDTGARLKALEERMDRVETLLRLFLGNSPIGSSAQGSTTSPPVRGTEAPSTELLLVRWSAIRQKCEYTECYRIAYTLRNDFSKPIKLIDASIDFSDLLGEAIFGIKLKEDVRIEPGSEVSSTGNYGINQFRTSERRLAEIPPADVQARLRVRAIVFGDNSRFEPK
jgi:hypothetical protein